MHRITVGEAERDFAGLVNRVYSEGVGIELHRDNKVVAYLTPAAPQSSLKVRDLAAFLQNLPSLEDDAGDFLNDLHAVRRETPAEPDPWA
jgi:antitoxin (DNA-binding transcriptional repressor) of toxin-antitoxin stability system